MSNCSNCYNGCTEITSDKCVKYTGIDVPVLGIQTGDSLSYVEQALITFLTSTLDGTGIIPIINNDIICDVVRQYLPNCGALTLNDILSALIKASCNLQEQVDAIDSTLATLNADYTIGCLTGVTASSDTHAIVQAVINKLCQVEVDLGALALDLTTNYVKIEDIDTYIAAYLANSGTSTKYYNRMIPYAVVEYYGPIPGNFDSTGAGIGDWEKIYLCNGNNGTPDKRGRVGIGTTDGSMLGLTMPADTNPSSSPFNPTYTLGSSAGSNQVILTTGQIPAHSHGATASATSTSEPHHHSVNGTTLTEGTPYSSGILSGSSETAPLVADPAGNLTGDTTAIVNTTVTVSIGSTGGNGAHSNVQVGLGCYYIQYRP